MRWVEMREQITGSRYDGQDWPPYGGIILVPDWEADRLIYTQRVAAVVPEDDPRIQAMLWDKLPEAEDKAPEAEDKAPEAEDKAPEEEDKAPEAAGDPGDSGGEAGMPQAEQAQDASDQDAGSRGSEEETANSSEETYAGEADGVKRPGVNESKQAWVDYAIARGHNPEAAKAMTKADLMSRYGSRL